MPELNNDIREVNRPGLLTSYIEVMSSYLCTMEHISKDEATKFIKKIICDKYKRKDVIYVKTIGPGKTQLMREDFWEFTKQLTDKVIAPSGSVYHPTSIKPSKISELLNFKKKQRSKVKKDQLKALANGDDVTANRFWYLQASIKILMNSLPGAFGSPYSIFYDKGNYNTITSTGRAMVRRSSTTTEQFLGGQFAWWSEQELINYILVNITYAPDATIIMNVINKYHMKTVTGDQLYEYYKVYFIKYTKQEDYLEVRELISQLSIDRINFLFYYCNLRNIMQFNSESFLPIIRDLLNAHSYNNIDGTADDIFKVPEDVRTLVSVAFTEALNGKSVDDIVKTNAELIPVFLGICQGIISKLNGMEDIFDTFCNTFCDIPNIKIRGQFSKRNTVVLQDTDSSMFTTKDWANWYHGSEKFNVDNESLSINALLVYWLSNIVKFAMYRFSVKFGVTSPHMRTLNFKNEFLYPDFLLSDLKKTYAATLAVKEGVVLNPYKFDIKGQQLRGSSRSKEVNQFIEDLLVNQILIPASKGKISAISLISSMVNFERNMTDSLMSGNITFMNTESIKLDKDYKNKSQPILQAYRLWESLLSKKYGSIMRPTKTIAFPCLAPSKEYLEWLQSAYPRFHKSLVAWMEANPKFPSKLIINPSLETVPAELIKLIDVRHLIMLNCNAIYAILSRLNISCGNPDSNILFSDLYTKVNT